MRGAAGLVLLGLALSFSTCTPPKANSDILETVQTSDVVVEGKVVLARRVERLKFGRIKSSQTFKFVELELRDVVSLRGPLTDSLVAWLPSALDARDPLPTVGRSVLL